MPPKAPLPATPPAAIALRRAAAAARGGAQKVPSLQSCLPSPSTPPPFLFSCYSGGWHHRRGGSRPSMAGSCASCARSGGVTVPPPSSLPVYGWPRGCRGGVRASSVSSGTGVCRAHIRPRVYHAFSRAAMPGRLTPVAARVGSHAGLVGASRIGAYCAARIQALWGRISRLQPWVGGVALRRRPDASRLGGPMASGTSRRWSLQRRSAVLAC